MNRENPRPGEYYRHFKNKLYEIVTIARHSETGEAYVVYRAMYGTFQDYIRPLSMFMSEVDHVKYPDVAQKYRFEKVGDRTEGLPALETAGEEQMKETRENRTGWAQNDRPEKSGAAMQADNHRKAGEEDPIDLLNLFLDEENPERRLELLARYQEKVDRRFLENVSLALDLSIPDGPADDQLYHLKRYLRAMMRYDGSRLRQ